MDAITKFNLGYLIVTLILIALLVGLGYYVMYRNKYTRKLLDKDKTLEGMKA